MNRRRFLVASALSFGGIALGAARAEAEGASAGIDDALARIAAARSKLTTLVGPFTQERTIGLLATRVKSTGTLVLVRPDRLRWELAPPDDVVYWVAPEGLAYRTKSGQARVNAVQTRLAQSLDDLRTLLGGDLARLRERYDLRLETTDGAYTFDATPKDPKAPITRLRFGLRADATPLFAELVEGPRDRTRIDFGALRENVPVDPALVRPPA
jgi:outer membrane lipoprotein-sorting protein